MITRAIAERESAWAQRPMFVPADPGSPNFQACWMPGDAVMQSFCCALAIRYSAIFR